MTNTETPSVVQLHPHVCTYRLWVDGKGWVSKSNCHYGDILPLDPPGLKGRRVA